MSQAGRSKTSQKTSDSHGNLYIEETNLKDTPGLLSNEFLVVDTRFDSRKMNVNFDGQYDHNSYVGFDDQ